MESTTLEEREAASADPPAGFPVTPRFDYVATLGRGGMGCVYEAIDRERGIAVALKTLLEMSPQRILYLKREFRALRDVHHPNLVSLGDLVEVDGTWFFTMELLRGPDLTGYVRGGARTAEPARPASKTSTTSLTWSHDGALEPAGPDPLVPPPPPGERPAPAFDERHLRDALRQLARGLMALHAAGLVHRDVKPSNILVEETRVVLLDFGIVGRLEGESHDGSVAGTWPYAAPEQLRGEPLSPAVDSYALGMCLFEALAGKLPLGGRPKPWLVPSRPPPDPRDYVRDLPDDLAALCVRLLEPEPVRRATMRDVLDVLDAHAPAGREDDLAVAPEPGFVGRLPELEVLHRAFEGASYGEPVCALVHGESGVGKTRLVQEFLARARRNRPTLVVLEARCHARELVPYGAIDGIVDGLAHHLTSPAAPALDGRLPAGIDALVRVFPVLATVPAIARARAATPIDDDDAAQRLVAFSALRELLACVAEEQVMVLSIDDLHWAEPDSLKLLAELFAPGRALPALLVATMQTLDDSPHAMVRASGCRVEQIHVRPLDERAAAELARGIGAALAVESPLDVDVIARDAGGHPLFIAELVHHARERAGGASKPVDLDAALRARIAALPAAARELLEVVTVAASPIAHEIAAVATTLDTASYADPMARLARGHLVRVTGVRRADHIEPYHKRVQAVVAATVAPGRRRELHHSLATALDDRDGAPETLAVHYELAGVRDRAAHHAARAAERAVAALAFERAASWYRKALELTAGDGEQRRRLAVALADVLVDAGHPLDAAEAYRAAAALGTPSAAEQFELRRRSADQYLVGGYLPQGVAAMEALLDEVGQGAPRSRAIAALKIALDHARLIARGVKFTPRDAHTIAPEQLAAIDVCWSGMSGVGQVDGMQGASFALRGTLLSLECGEPMRVARSLAMFAITEATLGHRARFARSLEASWHAARLAGTPHARFYPQLTELVCAYQVDHDWQRCLDGCRTAGQTWREAGRGRGWESNFIDVYTLLSLYRLGEVKSATEHVDRLLAMARASRNRFLETALRLLFSFRYLVLDRPADALADLEDAFSAWASSIGHISHQHYWRLLARTQIALYRGIGEVERDALDDEWRRMHRARLGRMGMYRLETQRALALFALSRASEARDRGDEAGHRHWLARSSGSVRELERTASPLAIEYALEITAAHETVAGRLDRAISALRILIPRLDLHRHRLAAMAARWSLGQLLGGTEGAALAATATTWAEAQGVRDLDRLARTVVPGIAGGSTPARFSR